ncbi:hypothetical protein STEG23_005167 [Scotinomys teguina]
MKTRCRSYREATEHVAADRGTKDGLKLGKRASHDNANTVRSNWLTQPTHRRQVLQPEALTQGYWFLKASSDAQFYYQKPLSDLTFTEFTEERA